MNKKSRVILAGLLVGFVLLQFTNPARTNPPVVHDFLATNAPPSHVAQMIRASCYDCHSNQTKWPWYSRIAPVSWLVVSDVNEGRQHLNLSDWPAGDADRAARKLDRMSEQIGYRDMPPGKYTLIHGDARLTEADRKELIAWLDAESKRLRAVEK
jgi:hypothetical protein